MTLCPCGSKIDYAACCGLYIESGRAAPSPEALMRSRYTAYTRANIEYIKNTMKGSALLHFQEIQAKNWAERVKWLGLKVIKTINDKDNQGHVEFIATFLEGGKVESIHELSEFLLEEGRWFYVDGQHQVAAPASQSRKIGRNDICPCGSQKKFKHCHAK